MSTIEMTDTLSRYGATLTRDKANQWGPRERWSGWNTDNTVLVSLSRNGDGWYVGTFIKDVPFGQHHRPIHMEIPDVDVAEAVDLALRTLAAINIDVRYETARRGYATVGTSTQEVVDFYAATLAKAVV